jgi:two-component system, OmpR family, phosphate regulon response regulator PhoB
MPRGKIFIVEDDKNISKLIKYNLEKEGFSCFAFFSGEEALKAVEKEKADLLILDIMLPGMDGLEVCRRIKKTDGLSGVPIIMLTAKGEEVDRIVGLELGADDYMVKPFSPRELVLRIKSILKRFEPKEQVKDVLKAGKIEIDIPRHKVTVNKKEVVLAPMEFKLLTLLIQRSGRVQTRERLLEDVWDIASDVTTRTVDTHIKRLREKLAKEADIIETVRGVGYRAKEN